MGYVLLALFIAVPLAEIVLFIVVGQQIGVLATIGATVLTAVAGVVLVRHQGLNTLERARHELAREQVPAGTLGEGVAILVAGAMLLTPGFLTDAIGFALLVPPLRRWLVRHIGAWIGPRLVVVERRAGRAPGGRGPVIEGEATEVDDEAPRRGPANAPTPWRRP